MSQFYRDLANSSAALVRVADKIANDKELYDYMLAEERSAFLWGMLLGGAFGCVVGFAGFMVGK